MSAHTALAPAPDLAPVVVDAAAVIAQHRRNHQECSCGDWPLGVEHEEHVALALHTAGVLTYTRPETR